MSNQETMPHNPPMCECHDCTQARYRQTFQYQLDKATRRGPTDIPAPVLNDKAPEMPADPAPTQVRIRIGQTVREGEVVEREREKEKSNG